MKTSVTALLVLCLSADVLLADAGGVRAYSMLTHDGRRLVSRMEGTNEVFELVATNALLIEKGLVARTDPENPMSPRQEYKLT